MLMNNLDAFPTHLENLVLSAYDRSAFAIRHDKALLDFYCEEIAKHFSPKSDVLYWEAAAVAGQEMLRAIKQELDRPRTTLKQFFDRRLQESCTKIENTLIQGFQKLAERFDGIKPNSDHIQQLRERYDPAVLDANGQSYKGLVSEHESIEGRPPVIQDPKAPGIR